jgi:hypothetical protein
MKLSPHFDFCRGTTYSSSEVRESPQEPHPLRVCGFFLFGITQVDLSQAARFAGIDVGSILTAEILYQHLAPDRSTDQGFPTCGRQDVSQLGPWSGAVSVNHAERYGDGNQQTLLTRQWRLHSCARAPSSYPLRHALTCAAYPPPVPHRGRDIRQCVPAGR